VLMSTQNRHFDCTSLDLQLLKSVLNCTYCVKLQIKSLVMLPKIVKISPCTSKLEHDKLCSLFCDKVYTVIQCVNRPVSQVGPENPGGHRQLKCVHSSTHSPPFSHGWSAHTPAGAWRSAHESRDTFFDVMTSSVASRARPLIVTSRRQPTNPDVVTSPACVSRVDKSLTPPIDTDRQRTASNLKRTTQTSRVLSYHSTVYATES